MFLKMRVPLLGLVENMSYHACPRCGHVEHVFGHGGVERAAKDYGVEVIGQVRRAPCAAYAQHSQHSRQGWTGARAS